MFLKWYHEEFHGHFFQKNNHNLFKKLLQNFATKNKPTTLPPPKKNHLKSLEIVPGHTEDREIFIL